MIYVTGDIHGNPSRIEAQGLFHNMTKDDMFLIAGDFGCIFGLGEQDEQKLNQLETLPFMILFIDGNHECFPKLYSYPEELWHGGRVHRIRKNVLHLMRGQVFDLDGTSVFTMGGAYSIDKMFRIPGKSWWPEEMPSPEEYSEALENLKKHNNSVDVIVSHAAPDKTMEMFVQTGVISGRYLQEMELNLFLEKVCQTVQYKHYYFGHMHQDMLLDKKQIALYFDVYRLPSGHRDWGGANGDANADHDCDIQQND